MRTLFVYSGEMGHFDFGYDHPYKPERAIKTFDLCTRYGVMNHPWMTVLDPEPLDQNLLTLFHTPELIRDL
jgi:histone deacetylase 1/2